MGILLTFMFVVNMLGAIFLLRNQKSGSSGLTGCGHAPEGILKSILNPDRPVGSQDGLDEEFLKSACLCLRHDKKADPKDDAGQAHGH